MQQLINGVLASGIYALFAVGFAIVFGIMGVLNMAHADFAMVAAFAMVWSVGAGLGPAAATAVAIVVTVAIALLIERFGIRPARRFGGEAGIELPLIATLGCGMVMQNAAALLFGNKAAVFPLSLRGYFRVGGLLLSQGLLVSALAAVVLISGLEVLLRRTDWGRQMRAVAQNRAAAEIMGINATLVIAASVGLTAALAGTAGLLVGLSYGLISPFLGLGYTIKGLIAMIIGGVGSVTGAALGALVIGLTEAVAVTLWGSQLRDLSVFVVLLAVVLLRPGGILPASVRS